MMMIWRDVDRFQYYLRSFHCLAVAFLVSLIPSDIFFASFSTAYIEPYVVHLYFCSFFLLLFAKLFCIYFFLFAGQALLFLF